MNKKPVDLRDRTLEFSRSVIVFVKQLDYDPLLKPISTQLIRSATSIGANFHEAKDSGSSKDFRHKVLISKKEASETSYWLSLLNEFTKDQQLKDLQKECHEITLILQKIVKTIDHKNIDH